MQQNPKRHFLSFHSPFIRFLPPFATTRTTSVLRFSSRLSIVGDTSRTEPTSPRIGQFARLPFRDHFRESRPTENPHSWTQARLTVRIPKTQPTSVLPVAWEESQRLSGRLPTTGLGRSRFVVLISTFSLFQRKWHPVQAAWGNLSRPIGVYSARVVFYVPSQDPPSRPRNCLSVNCRMRASPLQLYLCRPFLL